jgi:hypothetical protein
MFAAMGLATALVMTSVGAPIIQIDPRIAMGGTPQDYDGLSAYRAAREQQQQYRRNEAAMEAARAEAAEAARAEAAAALLREQVGGLLANDDCPGAVRAALAGGDFSLAREAREFCAGTTPAPAAPK